MLYDVHIEYFAMFGSHGYFDFQLGKLTRYYAKVAVFQETTMGLCGTKARAFIWTLQ